MAFAIDGTQCYDLTTAKWIEVSSSGRIYSFHHVEKIPSVAILHDQRLPFIHRMTLGSTLTSFLFTLISQLFRSFQLYQSVSTCVVSVLTSSNIDNYCFSSQKLCIPASPMRERPRRDMMSWITVHLQHQARQPKTLHVKKKSRVQRSSPLQQQLKSPTTPKRKPRRNSNSYRGPVIPFTPILSSTTFPTDHKAHPDTTPDKERTLSASGSDEQEETVHHPLGRSGREGFQHLPNMFSVPPNAATTGPGARRRPPITMDNTTTSRAGADLRGQGLGHTDNGPNNPVYMRNMELMGQWGEMTEFDRAMEAMKDSDEDEPEGTAAQAIAQELARGVHDYDSPLSWDDLPNALKLDVADSVNRVYDDPPEAIMNKLRLDSLQQDDLNQLLNQRSQRWAEEDRNGKLLRDHQREILLSGGSISSEENRDMMDRTIYRSTHEDPYDVATRAEFNKARRYLRHCGFDPSILIWLDPFTGGPFLDDDQDAAVTAQTEESSDSDGEAGVSSPPLAQLPTQASAPPPPPYTEPALPQLIDALKKDKQSTTSSHREPKRFRQAHGHTASTAPHTVPSRSFPVTTAHARAPQPVGPVTRPSLHDDRGRSILRANNMPPGQKYNPQPRVPPAPTEPLASSATGRLSTKPSAGAPIDNNKHAAKPHGGDDRNKRKRSSSGISEDGADRSRPRSVATRAYHVGIPAETSTPATRKPKKDGGSQEEELQLDDGA